MKLEIVTNGIYPIRYNEYNNSIDKRDFVLSEIIQTRGMFSGSPSLFIKTGICNLKCIKRKRVCKICCDRNKQKEGLETQTIANIIRNNIGNIKHLVISGGEPMLQSLAVIELLELVKDLNLIITIETNGTIYNEEIFQYADYISIFPILSFTNPTVEKIKELRKILKDKTIEVNEELIEKHNQDRVNVRVIQTIIDNCIISSKAYNETKNFTFNVKITCLADLAEFKRDFLDNLENWVPEDVNVVLCIDVDNKLDIVKKCSELGYNFQLSN